MTDMEYRIKTEPIHGWDDVDREWYTRGNEYNVQMRFLCFWITVRKFRCLDDDAYALLCAQELVEKLREGI